MGRKTKMNSITSQELLDQVNLENKKLKEDFLNYLRSIQRSPGTVYGYSNDIDIFFVWVLLNAGNKEFARITKRDIIAFQGWLVNDNENSPARIRRIKAAISSLSNFVENILDEEPEYAGFRSIVRKIESPALRPVREKTVWEDDELDDLLDKLVESKKYEEACYLALAMFSGRRKSELTRFRVDDFGDDHLVFDGAMYKSDPIKTKGRGGGKFIPCYTLAKKFKPYLDLWMDERKRLGVDSQWLFPSRTDANLPINISTLNSWAATFTKLSGRDFYAHSLRHYFTTSLARAGIPDGVIQSIVNWESGDMVRLYKDIGADEEISAYFSGGDIAVPEKNTISNI